MKKYNIMFHSGKIMVYLVLPLLKRGECKIIELNSQNFAQEQSFLVTSVATPF